MLNDYFKATFIAGALTVCLIIILGRLLYLQVYKHTFYENFSKKQSTAVITLDRNRGVIYDRNGKVLAQNVYNASVYVDASKVDNPRNFLYILKVNGIELPKKIKEKILKKDRFVWIVRGIDVEKAKKISRLDDNLQMILQENRFYPEGDVASKIVGFTGIDNQGLEGVEAFFDSSLKGEKVNVSVLKDSRGKTLVFEDRAVKTNPENSLYLSIDSNLQKVATSILYNDLKEIGAKSVFAAAMDVNTGEIIFSSSVPTYDSNEFDKYEKTLWKDPLFYYLFEPGSIFKAVTFSVLAEENLIKRDEKVYCENGKYPYAGHIFNDVHKFERLTYEEIFANSSNIGTIKLTEKISSAQFYKYLKKYGFGELTGTKGFAEESGFLRNVKDWSKLSKPSVSIGQEILVTPIQMLRFYGALANGGYAVRPTIIKGKTEEREKILSAQTATLLKKLLIAAVETGTGQNAKSELIKIAGKTGTAQKFDKSTNSYSYRDYNASFIGFFPVEKPRYVMIVTYDSPRKSIYGGSTAAYTFKKIAEQMAIHFRLNINKMMVENENRKAS
ncbi:penicillin-binding protein 2 [Deferribacterales bacterium Es71-Z0220]|jgi:cell division protein FtsI (penicillin-binding protein 3)|uniref:peptidoglycan D,D-transpeptidase FtsI family protein n=1 Tax=Deferrivibrio essentukiensis TaxID=2880922 RepID=UPI001F60D73E|nr:penicillin-binding protein 2 [Deferrivibrio essentukiensis]MBZ4672649.1 Peptidoglycan glycosyltransferase [Deferribacteraceae bacterium]MCB4205277.1 penicillin-binding protein 2 [Deferrivibrio essentukiensis]